MRYRWLIIVLIIGACLGVVAWASFLLLPSSAATAPTVKVSSPFNGYVVIVDGSRGDNFHPTAAMINEFAFLTYPHTYFADFEYRLLVQVDHGAPARPFLLGATGANQYRGERVIVFFLWAVVAMQSKG
jgi:hypothetical protein